MNTLIGTFIWVLGGLAGATFALPFRKVKGWSYESYWLIWALFGLILFPIALGLATVPNLFGVIFSAPAKTLVLCAAFGALWGIGGLAWGLMIRYLGVGLGLAIGCGLCSATGTLIPPIVKGQAASLVADKGAIITLASVIVSLLGIVFVGLAGKSKENELPEEEKKKAVAEFNFKKGLIVAIVAGLASAGMNFGLQSGGVLENGALDAGAKEVWKGMGVLVVVLFGGFIVQLIWCLQQNAKNKTFKDYATIVKPASAGVLFWSGLAGIVWACQFACQKVGESLAGSIAYISFAIVMGSSVLFSSLIGIALGEWKGTGAKTRNYLALGLVILAASIGIAVIAKLVK
ncbi:MAG: rhamnose/proton symporter RhaT [Kiritimatiellae bacterium]|nr:rhamnose/proton symporter RhaT [Kiritimatiellia bacterium]